MPEYIVEMKGTFHGSIDVEADSEDEAMTKANELGMEIANIAEILDSEAVSAEYFQD